MAKAPAKNTPAPVEEEVLKTPALHNVGPSSNPFETYGQTMTTSPIVGSLLKFNKGDYLAGQDEEDVPVGTLLVPDMDGLMIGWVKWGNNKPGQQIMGKLVEAFQPPRRNTLGDDDEDAWEVDTQGKPRDPWQFSNNLIMRPAGLRKAPDDDVLYTFSVSSKGGLTAIGELCKFYGHEMREHDGQYPVIALDVGSYKHSNLEYGRIKFPILKPTGQWEPKALEAPAAKLAAPTAAKKARAA